MRDAACGWLTGRGAEACRDAGADCPPAGVAGRWAGDAGRGVPDEAGCRALVALEPSVARVERAAVVLLVVAVVALRREADVFASWPEDVVDVVDAVDAVDVAGVVGAVGAVGAAPSDLRTVVRARVVVVLTCSFASGDSDVFFMKKTPFYLMICHFTKLAHC